MTSKYFQQWLRDAHIRSKYSATGWILTQQDEVMRGGALFRSFSATLKVKRYRTPYTCSVLLLGGTGIKCNGCSMTKSSLCPKGRCYYELQILSASFERCSYALQISATSCILTQQFQVTERSTVPICIMACVWRISMNGDCAVCLMTISLPHLWHCWIAITLAFLLQRYPLKTPNDINICSLLESDVSEVALRIRVESREKQGYRELKIFRRAIIILLWNPCNLLSHQGKSHARELVHKQGFLLACLSPGSRSASGYNICSILSLWDYSLEDNVWWKFQERTTPS